MTALATLALLLALGLDTLTVALGLGIAGLPRKRWLTVGLTFAAFEGGMPLLGLLVGHELSAWIGGLGPYVAAAILLVVGVLTIRESLDDNDDSTDVPLEAWPLILMAVSISVDELAVGFSLGMLAIPIVAGLAYLAAQAFAATFVGLWFGQRVGRKLGDRAELVAGVVLIAAAGLLTVDQLV
jgi:putative Mn2+ efflux pump MntP